LSGALSHHLVVMGVSGCGKSGVGKRLAATLGLPLIEGDDFHPPANKAKMASGQPLNDDDRADWLLALAEQLRQHPQGAILTCSALKKKYREVLRTGAARLRFIHLALPLEEAQRRVAKRQGHFYPPALVASQFEALEDPVGEPGVLRVDVTLPKAEVDGVVVGWLGG
jgi:gluconokinase